MLEDTGKIAKQLISRDTKMRERIKEVELEQGCQTQFHVGQTESTLQVTSQTG